MLITDVVRRGSRAEAFLSGDQTVISVVFRPGVQLSKNRWEMYLPELSQPSLEVYAGSMSMYEIMYDGKFKTLEELKAYLTKRLQECINFLDNLRRGVIT